LRQKFRWLAGPESSDFHLFIKKDTRSDENINLME